MSMDKYSRLSLEIRTSTMDPKSLANFKTFAKDVLGYTTSIDFKEMLVDYFRIFDTPEFKKSAKVFQHALTNRKFVEDFVSRRNPETFRNLVHIEDQRTKDRILDMTILFTMVPACQEYESLAFMWHARRHGEAAIVKLKDWEKEQIIKNYTAYNKRMETINARKTA